MEEAIEHAEKRTSELWGVLQKSICLKVSGKTVANSTVMKEVAERNNVRKKWHMQNMAVVHNLKLMKDGKPDRVKYK